MKKCNFKFLLVFLSLILLLLSFNQIYAQSTQSGAEGKDEVSLNNPLETDSPQAFIGQIIDASLGVVGSLALLMFVYGGFTWMLASGNSEKVEKGKNILFWATAGLVVIFTSYMIVHFVIFELIGAPGG